MQLVTSAWFKCSYSTSDLNESSTLTSQIVKIRLFFSISLCHLSNHSMDFFNSEAEQSWQVHSLQSGRGHFLILTICSEVTLSTVHKGPLWYYQLIERLLSVVTMTIDWRWYVPVLELIGNPVVVYQWKQWIIFPNWKVQVAPSEAL